MSAVSTLPQATLREIVRRIVAVAHPQRVILFGSHARGEADRYSDVDLLVVVPDSEDRRRISDRIHQALLPLDVPNDVLLTTPSQLAHRGDLVGMVYRPALREGRMLYDAACGGIPSDPSPLRGLEVLPVTESDRLAETQRWLHDALTDLRVAELALNTPGLDPHPACYHAQQAAEKALKAILVYVQIQYPFTHDLDSVRARIPSGWPVKDEFPPFKALSQWAYKARYPGEWAEPTAADAREALRWARAIYDSVLRDLADHGFTAGPR